MYTYTCAAATQLRHAKRETVLDVKRDLPYIQKRPMLYHKTPIPYRKRPAVYQKKATNTSTPAVRQVLMSMSTTSI